MSITETICHLIHWRPFLDLKKMRIVDERYKFNKVLYNINALKCVVIIMTVYVVKLFFASSEFSSSSLSILVQKRFRD